MGQSSVVKIRQTEMDYYVEKDEVDVAADPVVGYMSREQLEKMLVTTRRNMEKAARELDFMEAARLRDEMFGLEKLIKEKSS
jgi:excinuclease ABC subunit B